MKESISSFIKFLCKCDDIGSESLKINITRNVICIFHNNQLSRQMMNKILKQTILHAIG